MWPKPGFGIWNWNQDPLSVSVTEPIVFFRIQFFSFFLKCFPASLGDISCKNLEIEHRSSKIMQQISGALLWWKKSHILSVNRYFVWNVISVLVIVLARSISWFGFWFRYWTKTKMVFWSDTTNFISHLSLYTIGVWKK